jgi:phosphate transport system permease protein
VANLPWLSRPVTFLTTAIAKELGYAAGDQRRALFSIGLVLFLLIMVIGGGLRWYLRGRGER